MSIIIIIEAYQTWEIIIIDDKPKWTLTWIIIMSGNDVKDKYDRRRLTLKNKYI